MEHNPCSPEIRENCRVFQAVGECFEDLHHDYWPRRDYKTKVEKEFRGLQINERMICRALHNTIHATQMPPIKPTRDQMLGVIDEQK